MTINLVVILIMLNELATNICDAYITIQIIIDLRLVEEAFKIDVNLALKLKHSMMKLIFSGTDHFVDYDYEYFTRDERRTSYSILVIK